MAKRWNGRKMSHTKSPQPRESKAQIKARLEASKEKKKKV